MEKLLIRLDWELATIVTVADYDNAGHTGRQAGRQLACFT